MIKFFLLVMSVISVSALFSVQAIIGFHSRTISSDISELRCRVSAFSALSILKSRADSIPVDPLIIWTPLVVTVNNCELFGAQLVDRLHGKAVCGERQCVMTQRYMQVSGSRTYLSYPYIGSD